MSSSNPSTASSSTSRPKKSRLRWYLAAGVLVALGVMGGVGAKMKKERDKVVVVTTEKAVIRTLVQLVSATGKIQPEIEVKISPEVAGEIVELPFREGAEVKKGDLLMRIKQDNYQAQVEQREADLAAARSASIQAYAQLGKANEDFKRTRDIHVKNLVTDSEFTAVRTSAEVAQANYDNSLAQIRRAEGQLKQAKDQLEKTAVFAPIDGTISSLASERGERVVATGQFAGTEVMRVANLSSMEVRVNVNENDVVNVKVGDRARILIDAYPNRVFPGVVREIASSAKTQGANTQEEITNFLVKIGISELRVSLRPGMSANAEIETQTIENVVAVPIQAVTVRAREGGKTMEELAKVRDDKVREAQGEGAASAVNDRLQRDREKTDRESLQRVVFVKQGDKVAQVPVVTGVADSTYIEIKSGIKPGDEVISGSFSAIVRVLKDGSQIRMEPTKKEGG